MAEGNKSCDSLSINSQTPTTFETAKTYFFFKVERELEKVNSFYLRKEAELRSRLKSLVDKKNILISRNWKSFGSVSSSALLEAAIEFQQDLDKLLRYVEMNELGFSKILKKWDKRSKMRTKEIYISRQVEIQPCFNRDVLNEFGDVINAMQAEVSGTAIFSASTADPETSAFVSLDQSLLENESETILFNALITGKPKEFDFVLDVDMINRVVWKLCGQTEFCDELFDFLQEKFKIDFNHVDEISDRTCLHQACMSGSYSLLVRCVAGGGNISCRDVYGKIPLHYVAINGYYDCCKYLLDCICTGTNEDLVEYSSKILDTIDHDGFSPLLHAIMQGHDKIVQLFLERGASFDSVIGASNIPLCLACEFGNTRIVQLLIDHGASFEVYNQDGLFPIHLACRNGNLDILKIMSLQSSTKTQFERKDQYLGWTPLFYAANEGHFECVKFLIDNGCKSIFDENKWNPWCYALYNGHAETAELLEKLVTIEEKYQMGSPSNQNKDLLDLIPPLNLGECLMGESEQLQPLVLPPPMIPVYGHNFLEKKFLVSLFLGQLGSLEKSAVRIFNTKQPSLKLTISQGSISNESNRGIPYNVMFPSDEENEAFNFTFDDFNDSALIFTVNPSFGSKGVPIGRGVIQLSDYFHHNYFVACNSNLSVYGRIPIVCPLLDFRLRIVGEVRAEIYVVLPFHHSLMDIGNSGTYWKTAQVVSGLSPAPNSMSSSPMIRPKVPMSPKKSISAATSGHGNLASFIVATSLAASNLQLILQITKDNKTVVYDRWYVQDDIYGMKVPICEITLDTFRKLIGKRSDLSGISDLDTFVESIYKFYPTLNEVLTAMNEVKAEFGLNLDLKYPFYADNEFPYPRFSINEFAYIVLKEIFDYLKLRSVADTSKKFSFTFSSANPDMCVALNLKQPNFAVFYKCNCGYFSDDDDIVKKDVRRLVCGHSNERLCGSVRCCLFRPDSLKEAMRFAKREGLLGLICESSPFMKVPSLVNTVKESGLVLSVFRKKKISGIL